MLFSGVSDATHAALKEIERAQSYAVGEVISTQGSPATSLFLIVSGLVRVSRTAEDGTPITLALLGPGEPIGTLHVARDMPLTGTATAHAPAEVIHWPIDALRRIMAGDPVLAANVMNVVARYAMQMIERLEEVTTAPVEQRVARALCRAKGIALARNKVIDLPLSRQDIADLSATTLPTVSRIMARWREEGLIGGHRGHIHLLDQAGLRAIAAFPDGTGVLEIPGYPS